MQEDLHAGVNRQSLLTQMAPLMTPAAFQNSWGSEKGVKSRGVLSIFQKPAISTVHSSPTVSSVPSPSIHWLLLFLKISLHSWAIPTSAQADIQNFSCTSRGNPRFSLHESTHVWEYSSHPVFPYKLSCHEALYSTMLDHVPVCNR